MKECFLLFLISIIALLFRSLFFPDNVYFGYDQARDSFSSIEILKGGFKIIGPPSSLHDNLFHGPLIYYIYAPIYLLFNNNPEAVSFIFRLMNASGLFLVYIIASNVFNKKVGLIAAFLFAISYEQSQYSLFFSHPSLAVLTVLLYYLGLSLLLFRKNPKGLLLALLGIGLSIQFHFVNLLLFVGFFISLIYFYTDFKILKKRLLLLSLMIFLFSVSTFLIAEYKFHFRQFKALAELNSSFTFTMIPQVSIRSIHDNFVSDKQMVMLLSFILAGVATVILINKSFRKQAVFLVIWFFTGLVPYLSGTTSYYHNPATSVSLIIFLSLIINWILKKNILIGLGLMLFITVSNINLILNQNMKGPNKDFVIQPGLLISDEKKVIDFCYSKAQGRDFALNGLTIPLYINTTWSYLFEWYGKQKYHYLPVWGGKAAEGFAGNLRKISKRSDLPLDQCLIIEPTVGISEHDKNDFFREESYFSQIVEQTQFGTITVQYRRRI